MLIINADDLGLNRESIVRTRQCHEARAITSASLMVFMAHSQDASVWARDAGIETGLHINLTEPFDAPNLQDRLRDDHQSVARYLGIGKPSSLLFNPLLKGKIDRVFKAQYDEYCRLWGAEPSKIDGHHHMHLSMNILLSDLIPRGTIVRRNFSFKPGEKNRLNRAYRKLIDMWLRRRFRCTDAFFSIKPLEDLQRLRSIIGQSLREDVEVAVHPMDGAEHAFLVGPQFLGMIRDAPLGEFSKMRDRGRRPVS